MDTKLSPLKKAFLKSRGARRFWRVFVRDQFGDHEMRDRESNKLFYGMMHDFFSGCSNAEIRDFMNMLIDAGCLTNTELKQFREILRKY